MEKYIGTEFDIISYGAVQLEKTNRGNFKKIKNTGVFVGRLEKDTGVLQLLRWLRKNRKIRVDFIGDGELRGECEKYGTVWGFTDPHKFLKNAYYSFPGGYLACLESMAMGCRIKVFWSDNLKRDYWQMSPMYQFVKNGNSKEATEWVKKQSWNKLANDYFELWGK